jgi:hypothetical protein
LIINHNHIIINYIEALMRLTMESIKMIPSLVNRELQMVSSEFFADSSYEKAITNLVPQIMGNLQLPAGRGIEDFIAKTIKNDYYQEELILEAA